MDSANFEDAARRRAFVSYFQQRWGHGEAAQKQCAAETGYTEGRISQILRGTDRFGEQAAKNMARACGLPETAFLAFGGLDAENRVADVLRADGWAVTPPDPKSLPAAFRDGERVYLSDLFIQKGDIQRYVEVTSSHHHIRPWKYNIMLTAARARLLLAITPGSPSEILRQVHMQLEHPGQMPWGADDIPLKRTPDFFPVQRVTIKVSAGATGYAIDFIHDEGGEPVMRPAAWFRRHGFRPEKVIAVAVINGSMEPNYQSGDVLLVDTENTELKDGAPVVANFEGEPVVKRLQRDAGQWWLTSDNPDKARYPRKLCGDGVTIVGRVVWRETEHV